MSLYIHNTLTNTKEEFTPINKGRVAMYVCGPTVYDVPHIGHARSAYVFDVIRRYLEYKGLKVAFVRNVTDVDDKIINKAKEEPGVGGSGLGVGEKVKQISEKYLKEYHDAMKLLGIKTPTKEPKATEYIKKMQAFIKLLIGRGAAYEAGGDVYFDIRKAKGYGKLSNQSIDQMEAGARVSAGENKKDPLDFALWKKAKSDEPSWKSPWGEGRPGWHIECSVMSSDILGDEFDIHGGGRDLIFPHHENEMAQSEGAGKKFARHWIHHGLLTINGQKMAKSLGNFITVGDFLSKHKNANYLKLLFLTTHYSHPVDYTEEKITEAKKAYERFVIFLDRAARKKVSLTPNPQSPTPAATLKAAFEAAMDDDFNTPQALSVLFDFTRDSNKLLDGQKPVSTAMFKELASILGLTFDKGLDGADKQIKQAIQKRQEFRKQKKFKEADKIRDELLQKGIILEDTKDGVTWRRKL